MAEANVAIINTEDLFGPLNEIEAKYAPKKLFVAGDESIARTRPRVSVIGSRHPSEEGTRNTEEIVKRLVKRGAVIVSGLAAGVDTIAHKTAIREGGKTIAVLGTPINQCYPKENCNLQQEIISHHLAISQFEPNLPIQPGNFPLRNRTMALISNASIIVEAGEASGSRHQGWEALRLGRPLIILDAMMKNKKLRWPQEMINYGAKVLSIKDILSLLDILPAPGNEVDIIAAIHA